MQLLKHFKELTLRPKNAQELKGLILQLAVQGKLTANWRLENSEVEPASYLLENIKRQKLSEKEKGRSNKGKLIDVIDPIESYGKLPKSWEWVHLDDVLFYITDYQANGSFATLKANVQYYDSPNYAVLVRLKDLRHDLTKSEGFKYTDEKGYKFLKKSSIYGGELLIANVGAGVGTIIEVPQISFKATLAPNMFSVYPATSGVDKSYFQKYSKSPLYWMELRRQVKGTGQPKINKSEYRSCRFPLPPLAEQKAIVKIVETLFKEVEQLEQLTLERISLKEKFVASALNQLTTNNAKKEWAFLQEHFHSFFNETSNIKKLRETILQLAVQGKLTADWRANNPDIENAAVLLKRIKAEKGLHFIEEFEVPYKLSPSWEWSKFVDVAELRHGHQFRSYDFVEEGIPVIKIGQCKADGTLDFSKCNYIDSSRKEEFEQDLIFQGHLLMALTGGTLGKVTRVDKDYGTLVQNYRVGNFFADERVISLDFLNVILESELFQGLVEERINQNAQPNIGKDNIEKILMPIPPLEEQKMIVQKVNALMGLCDALEQQVKQSQEQSEKLMQSVLREVFEGKKELETV